MTFRRILIATSFIALGCRHGNVPVPAFSPATTSNATSARGESIVRNAAVCGQCHAADPQRDVDGPLSGGMEFSDWRIGTARAANLTSDVETGLGSWSDAEIVRKSGSAWAGRTEISGTLNCI